VGTTQESMRNVWQVMAEQSRQACRQAGRVSSHHSHRVVTERVLRPEHGPCGADTGEGQLRDPVLAGL
jgi:hypothetical protein